MPSYSTLQTRTIQSRSLDSTWLKYLHQSKPRNIRHKRQELILSKVLMCYLISTNDTTSIQATRYTRLKEGKLLPPKTADSRQP